MGFPNGVWGVRMYLNGLSGLDKSKKVNSGQVRSGENKKSELGQLKLDRSSQESFWTKISF